MNKLSKIAAVFMSASMVMPTLSGCGSGDNANIVTMVTIKDYYTTALEQVAADYNKDHPDTKVQIQVIGSNETYSQNFITKVSTSKNTAPDIIHTNLIKGNSEGDMINKGWLLPLNDLLEEENPYNESRTVREGFTDEYYLARAVSSVGKVGYLPFDHVGIAFFYNKTIFDKEGITVPTTYEELDAALIKLEKAGYKDPLGATSHLSYIANSLADWGFRDMETDFLTLPGDAAYDEETMSQNLDVVYSPDDLDFDAEAIFNTEKILAYMYENGVDSPVTKKTWETTKKILEHCPEGWTNADDGQTYNQFIAQKVPVFISGSWNVGSIVKDISELPEDKKFEWSTFQFPSLAEEDPEFEGAPRGVLLAGHKLGIVDKGSSKQTEVAKDFLKYLYSPEVATNVYKITLENGELVQGPSLIDGVELSDELSSYLDGFEAAGAMTNQLAKLIGMNKAGDEALMNSVKYDYVEGKIDYDEFVKKTNEITKAYVEDMMKTNNYDLDPTT